MRVIAGSFKGRKIAAPKGDDIRPTTDRVKEAIFSMIQENTEGSVCLDLFAGTGALGIEALSRGAERVYFCDNAPAALESLRRNLDACRAGAERAVILKADWRNAVFKITEKCNLVFIDAPYEMCEYYPQILTVLSGKEALRQGAYLVIERDAGAGGYALPAGYERIQEKRYGGIGVDLLRYAGTE